MFKCFVVEHITADAVAQMHIHHAPWRKYGFLVGVAKRVENSSDTSNALFHAHLVGSTCHRPDAFAGGAKHIGFVVFLEFFEYFFGNPSRHKFFPRLIVDEMREIVDGKFFVFVAHIRSINQQRHTDGNATKNGNGRIAVLLSFRFFGKQSFFFFGKFFSFAFLLFHLLQLLILFVGETLLIQVDIAAFGHCLRAADNSFKTVKIFQFHLFQLHQVVVVVEITILESVADYSFHIHFFQLFEHSVHVVGFHTRTFDGNNGTEVEKFAHRFAIGHGGFSGFCRYFGCFGNYP